MMKTVLAGVMAAAGLAFAPAVFAQGMQEAAGTAGQRAAVTALDMLDGRWVGPAWRMGPDGKKVDMTHTERVGSLLGGSVKMFEGRSYTASGDTAFNALGVISWSDAAKAYSMRAYAQSYVAD